MARQQKVQSKKLNLKKFKAEPQITRQTKSFLSSPINIPPAVTIDKLGFTPSKYQRDYYEEFLKFDGHIALVAEPGSGKSTTILGATKLAPSKESLVYVAYNKAIQTAFAPRIAPRPALTVHALAYSALRNAFGHVNVLDRKVKDMLFEMLRPKGSYLTRSEFDALRSKVAAVEELVKLCKLTLTKPNEITVEQLIDKYGIDTEMPIKDITDLTVEVFEKSLENTSVIDFNDMLYMVVANDIPVEKFDRVLIDEGQDFSKCQTAVALKALAKGGSISVVGDPNQAIYGFAGAGIDSLEQVIAQLNAKVMPLSITYRCPRSHVELAREIMPSSNMEAAPGAEEGLIDDITASDLYRHVLDGDMVLCRTNRPLVAAAFALIRRGVKAVVRGREIGQGLVMFVDRFKANTLDMLDDHMSGHLSKKGDKLLQRGELAQYDLLVDKIETVRIFADEANSVAELKLRIASLFTDDLKGVLLSSVHKAKGLEADRVFILKPELMPFPKVKKDWEIKQEMNLKFVASTRSKSELYFVQSEDDEEEF